MIPKPDRTLEFSRLESCREQYPEKFVAKEIAFSKINRGDKIFISTGCGEPQYLVNSLVEYVKSNPKAFFDAEILQVWTLGVTPYADEKFKHNFRHNSFFIGSSSRDAVNKGLADFTPIFLSEVPSLFKRKQIEIDVALIQTSMPDNHGYLSLGVSVDITKTAIENSRLVIAQINPNMPRVHGDGFINIKDVSFAIPYEEPLLEYLPVTKDDETVNSIAKYVSRLIRDGDTIQVGYGALPNAIAATLKNKKHLGIHTELISDGIVELMKIGAVDNSCKTVDSGKSVAAFCMGKHSTYEFLHDNPLVELKTIDYTNNPLIIARQSNMTAINSALEIDLTGQATATSLGKTFFSAVGGQADFMRGAVLAQNGKSILAMQSTAEDGNISRIVPYLHEGADATLIRGDVHYVITEYGIAYLHGKNIRERAMELISIAHPKFRPWLIQEAKKGNLIYKDQAFIPGKKGQYPEIFEAIRTTEMGFEVFFRPVKISDEPLLKDFFYSLSDESIYRRFISSRKDMPHERLQEFVVIDYSREMMIVATIKRGKVEEIVGLAQYGIDETTHTAEVAFVVKDEYQNKGVGTELVKYITLIARRQGLLGFTAEVLKHNKPMLHLFEKMGFDINQKNAVGDDSVYELKLAFRGK